MSSPTTIEIHGPALRAIRVLSGIGVADLANAAGVKRPYIAKIELGHSRRVSPKTFNSLVAALGLADRRALMLAPYGEVDETAVA